MEARAVREFMGLLMLVVAAVIILYGIPMLQELVRALVEKLPH